MCGFALDGRIRASGWYLFFMAGEVRAMFLGGLGTKKIQKALTRILTKVRLQRFNGLEVTRIVAKRFLRVPYGVVSAHSRHAQHSCYLDSAEARRMSQHDAEWARR